MARRSPTISHLLFADDGLFFCKGEEAQSRMIKNIFRKIWGSINQKINYLKSSLMFGNKVLSDAKDRLKGILNITKEGAMCSYLGIPEILGGSKSKIFNYVTERLND